jgi:hypothetical protein
MFEMKNISLVILFILIACFIYLYRSRDFGASMDDRVSVVIALGKFPPLAEQFS